MAKTLQDITEWTEPLENIYFRPEITGVAENLTE